MRHEVRLQGHAFGLRPVETSDAEFILELRSDPELARYLHHISPCLSDQQQWIRDYYKRDNDYYFIVERLRTSTREGTVGLYDLDLERGDAEWGRWILRRHSSAALETAMLIYQFAFDVLGLQAVYCRTVADNTRVVSFHSSFGLLTVPDSGRSVFLRDTRYAIVEQRLTADLWHELRPAHDRSAAGYARILSR